VHTIFYLNYFLDVKFVAQNWMIALLFSYPNFKK